MGLCTGTMNERIPKPENYDFSKDKIIFMEDYNDELNDKLNDLSLNESETSIWFKDEDEDHDEYIYNYDKIDETNKTRLSLQPMTYSLSTIDSKSTLSNETNLNAFASHLSKEEFRIEILTTYIQFTQFQRCLISNGKVDPQRMQNDVGKVMDFSGNKEQKTETETKLNNEELIDFKYKAHELWKKYIDVSLPNEINISGQDRTLLDEALGDYNKLISNSEIGYDQLFDLVEKCRAELAKKITEKEHRQISI